MRGITSDAKKAHGSGGTDPVLRHTEDADGNMYYWAAGDSLHSGVEPHLGRHYGIDVHQNKFSGKTPHRSAVKRALYEGEDVPQKVLNEYPGIVEEIRNIPGNKIQN